MKYVRVLLRDGTKKRVTEVGPKERVIGIVLRGSKKIVSLNTYYFSIKNSTIDFSDIIESWIGNIWDAREDVDGVKNTERFRKHELLKIKLRRNEYVPSLGELIEAVRNLKEINFVRRKFRQYIIKDCWLFSSTIKSRYKVWVLHSEVNNYAWDSWGVRTGPILTFLKDKNLNNVI